MKMDKLIKMSQIIRDQELLIIEKAEQLSIIQKDLDMWLLDERAKLETAYTETKDKSLSNAEKRDAKIWSTETGQKSLISINLFKKEIKILDIELQHNKRLFEIALKYDAI